MKSISEDMRLKSEERYHDKKYLHKDNEPLHYAYNPTYYIFIKMLDMIYDIKGKEILECGCGDGWITAELASLGAKVHAFDISAESVNNTIQLLRKHNLQDNCIVAKKSAEEIDYSEEKFDIVIGFAVLHHLNLDKSIPHIHRVLKPKGLALFAEPLSGNPIINIYRKLTPKYRTPDEEPINLDKFTQYISKFKRFSHEEFFLLSLLPLFLSNFNFYKPKTETLKRYMLLDTYLFCKLPFLRKWAWYSILSFEK